jgi:hypothetical protein
MQLKAISAYFLIASSTYFMVPPPLRAMERNADAASHAAFAPKQRVQADGETTAQLVPQWPTGTAPELAAAGSAEGSGGNGGGISGTVTDTNGDIVSGVTVSLDDGTAADHRETVTSELGAFDFESLKSGTPYSVSIHASGFSEWKSPVILLAPVQHQLVKDIVLHLEATQTSVTVYASNEQMATEQVHLEEQQRVLGIIPNFYVVYDAANAVPLTTKLKFKMALRVSVDPITILGVAFMAGIDQAADRPGYVLGAKGYGERFGANAADGLSDILIGGAILPSLLHQDPRYYYQGTGTIGSRFRHAAFNPFICKGDNGKWQVNASSIGGDLISSALSNTYYPQSDRGVGLVFGNFAISTAERVASGLAQEFILRRFTSKSQGAQ